MKKLTRSQLLKKKAHHEQRAKYYGKKIQAIDSMVQVMGFKYEKFNK